MKINAGEKIRHFYPLASRASGAKKSTSPYDVLIALTSSMFSWKKLPDYVRYDWITD